MKEKIKHVLIPSSETVVENRQPDNNEIIQQIISNLNYKNATIEEISEGDVHYVYKVKSSQEPSFYIKIRREHFKSNKSISINPKDIQTEKKAIDLLNNCLPNIAPKILYFSEEFSTLCLEDVVKENQTVTDLLVNSCPNEYKNLGNFIGKLHNTLSKKEDSIRGIDEEKFYKDSLYYRLGLLSISQIDELVSKLYEFPRQNIHGDLTPWNIVWNQKDNNFRLYDLETMHQGNTIFDLAFLEAHIILENFFNPTQIKTLISSFREGYKEYCQIVDEDTEVRLAFALVLLRLRGSSTYRPKNECDHQRLDSLCCETISTLKTKKLTWNSIDFLYPQHP